MVREGLKEQEKTSLKKWGNVMKMSIHTLNLVHVHSVPALSVPQGAVNRGCYPRVEFVFFFNRHIM